MYKTEALKKIEKLDPLKDAWEIVRLSIQYEFPWDYNRALELGLYKTYAIPSISKILHRTKELEKHTQKRYDDTDILLSEILENGLKDKDGRGWKAMQQINWIHSNYNISNDDYLYVLCTFIFPTYHWINKYGYRKLTYHEELAGFYIWKEIGEAMHIKNIPDNIKELEKFYVNYEKENMKFSDDNIPLASATENMFLGWYLPMRMHKIFRPLLYSVMDNHLLNAFNYNKPDILLRNIVTQSLRIRSKVANLISVKPFVRTKDFKHKAYPNGYQLEDLGPEKLLKSPQCPFRKT